MSNDNTALQANFKTQFGTLLNVYGATPEAFEHHLRMFQALLGDILALEQQVVAGAASANPVAVVQNTFPGATVVEKPTKPQAQAAPTAGGAPVCRHGAMNLVEGNKGGKKWRAYMCAAGKDAVDKCSPQWL